MGTRFAVAITGLPSLNDSIPAFSCLSGKGKSQAAVNKLSPKMIGKGWMIIVSLSVKTVLLINFLTSVE